MRNLLFGLVAALLFATSSSGGPVAASEAAASALPVGTPLAYHCQWTQRLRNSTPWTGDMTITVNAEGIINGKYKSTSIKPDPLYGRIITVTGGLTGKDIRLSFGVVPSLTVRGQVMSNGIQGTSSYNGGTLVFACAVAKSH
jgi:hypothetical protein